MHGAVLHPLLYEYISTLKFLWLQGVCSHSDDFESDKDSGGESGRLSGEGRLFCVDIILRVHKERMNTRKEVM